MMERFSHLRRKEVINICDGRRLGFVGDLELKVPEGEVKALIVFGPCRFFGLFGRGEEASGGRSGERRVGKESRSRWSPYH